MSETNDRSDSFPTPDRTVSGNVPIPYVPRVKMTDDPNHCRNCGYSIEASLKPIGIDWVHEHGSECCPPAFGTLAQPEEPSNA